MRFFMPVVIGLILVVSILAQRNDENLEHRIASGIGEGAKHAADGVTYVRDETGRLVNAAGEKINEAGETVADETGRLVNAAGEKINEAGETVGEAATNMKEDLSRKADTASNYVGQKLENAGREMQGKETFNSASSLSFAASLLTVIFVLVLL